MKLRSGMVCLIIFGCFFLSACGSSDPSSSAGLPKFNDITNAPAVVQQAAKAVVRVRVARSVATGSFISPTGLMLTNNHVLGVEVCPTEGCYVEVTFDWQAGSPYSSPQRYFAVPKAVDVGLDMALVQFYQYQGGPALQTPNYLTLRSQLPAALLGTHVTVVGHPEGYLKKWTDGFVADVIGEWIKSTAYSIPGDSGSPMINDSGEIVALLHRVPITEDLFTNNGAGVFSIGTASAPLIAAMAAPLPATMISTAAPTTTADFLADDLVYLNAHSTTVTVDGAPVSPLTVLAQACDAALARTDFVSPDDMSSALKPCYHAQTWIDCRSDASPVPYGTMCPPSSELSAWETRFKKMNDLQVAMNGAMDLFSVSAAIAHLQPSVEQGTTAGAAVLQNALAQANPVLDFQLAGYLAEFDILSYGGQSLAGYVTNYSNDPVYLFQGGDVAWAGGWLNYQRAVSSSEYRALLSRLHADPNATVGTKLYIEDIQHSMGAL